MVEEAAVKQKLLATTKPQEASASDKIFSGRNKMDWKDRQIDEPKSGQSVIGIYQGRVISGYFTDSENFYESYLYDSEDRSELRKGINLYFPVKDIKI